MAQVSMTVRLDSQLKKQFNELCNEIGMSANTAINVFVKAAVRTRSIPFKIDLNEPEAENPALKRFQEFRASVVADDSRPKMTLDEINEEIKLAREERKRRKQ